MPMCCIFDVLNNGICTKLSLLFKHSIAHVKIEHSAIVFLSIPDRTLDISNFGKEAVLSLDRYLFFSAWIFTCLSLKKYLLRHIFFHLLSDVMKNVFMNLCMLSVYLKWKRNKIVFNMAFIDIQVVWYH